VVDVVLVFAVSVCVGAVVSVFVGRGVGFERAGDELDDPVGGDDGWGTTVVVATAAPGAVFPGEVSRVLVMGAVVVDRDDDGGFIGIVVLAAVAVVTVVSVDITPPAGTAATPVSVAPALLVVIVELVVSVVALDADSLLLHASISIATATGITIFRMKSSAPLRSITLAEYADGMRRLAAALVLAYACTALASPHVVSVAEREVVPRGTLTVRVAELPSLRCDTLVLFIDGSALDGLRPACTATDARFALAVTSANANVWRTLFGRPHGFTRGVSVSVGPNDYTQLPTDVIGFPLRLVHAGRFALVAILTLLALGAIVIVRLRTTLITNLPRLQIAFFFVVVGASYGWLWATTGELTTLNFTALALLGIGAGTTLGNAAFGSSSRVSAADAAKRIANAAQSGVAPPVETRVVFGIHTLQAAALTIVLGVVFIASVYRNAEMPQFGSQELLLLGISGGTYLAFAFGPAPHA
jgi:hypothetical protein